MDKGVERLKATKSGAVPLEAAPHQTATPGKLSTPWNKPVLHRVSKDIERTPLPAVVTTVTTSFRSTTNRAQQPQPASSPDEDYDIRRLRTEEEAVNSEQNPSSSLLDGAYDEQANAQSFQQALNDWKASSNISNQPSINNQPRPKSRDASVQNVSTDADEPAPSVQTDATKLELRMSLLHTMLAKERQRVLDNLSSMQHDISALRRKKEALVTEAVESDEDAPADESGQVDDVPEYEYEYDYNDIYGRPNDDDEADRDYDDDLQ